MSTTITLNLRASLLADLEGHIGGAKLMSLAFEERFCPYFDIFDSGMVCLRGNSWEPSKKDGFDRGHVILGRLPKSVRKMMWHFDMVKMGVSKKKSSFKDRAIVLRVVTKSGQSLLKQIREQKEWFLR